MHKISVPMFYRYGLVGCGFGGWIPVCACKSVITKLTRVIACWMGSHKIYQKSVMRFFEQFSNTMLSVIENLGGHLDNYNVISQKLCLERISKIIIIQNDFCTRQEIEHFQAECLSLSLAKLTPPGFSILSPRVKETQSCWKITL